MNWAQVRSKLEELIAAVNEAIARQLGKDAIAGALAGGIGLHQPYTQESQLDGATVPQMHDWGNGWIVAGDQNQEGEG